MKQEQSIILDATDMQKLKSGEELTINLSNGNSIFLRCEKVRKPYGSSEGPTNQILDILTTAKNPLRAVDIKKLVRPENIPSVASALARLLARNGVKKTGLYYSAVRAKK